MHERSTHVYVWSVLTEDDRKKEGTMARTIFFGPLVVGLIFWGCGGGDRASKQPLTPPDNAIAYVDSNGVELGTPEDVAALKEVSAAANAGAGVAYFDRDPNTGQFTLTMKKSTLEDAPPDSTGGGGAYCPGGECTRSSSQGSCSVSCPSGSVPICISDPLSCVCFTCNI